MKTATRGLVIVLCALVTACGFHLRGRMSLPDGVEPIYISGYRDHPLEIALHNTLTAAGVHLTDNAFKANYQLQIVKQSDDRRTASIGAGALPAEYQLFETVVYELRDDHGAVVIGPNKLTEQRTLYNDPNQVVSTAAEEIRLREDMRQQLAERIVQQLRAFDYRGHQAARPAS